MNTSVVGTYLLEYNHSLIAPDFGAGNSGAVFRTIIVGSPTPPTPTPPSGGSNGGGG